MCYPVGRLQVRNAQATRVESGVNVVLGFLSEKTQLGKMLLGQKVRLWRCWRTTLSKNSFSKLAFRIFSIYIIYNINTLCTLNI